MCEAKDFPPSERDELMGLVTQLQGQVAQLTAAKEELHKQVAELKRAGKRQAAPFSKGGRSSRPKRPGRKPGMGSFSYRKSPSPDEVTEPLVEVAVAEGTCPGCGGRLEHQGVRVVYATDIPPIPRPQVTGYRVQICRCRSCGKQVRGRHPDVAPDQYGASAHRVGRRVMAAAYVLHYGVGVPVRKVPAVLRALTGVELSQGAISQDALRRARGAVGDAYHKLRGSVRASPLVHTDDTGLRVDGGPAFLMAFETDEATVYQVRARHRNEEVREVVPSDYGGVMVTDRGRSYDAQALSGVKQQKCLAHVLRSISEVVETKRGVLSYLKARGVLKEPPRNGISTRKRLWRRPYAVRKPKGYLVVEPGNLVQLDTLDVRPVPCIVLKHFTARDVVSRWDVVEAHTRATATTAAGFLDALQARMPFPVRAIQVDGGSEFQAGFEQACQQRDILLFTLPPRSPKLNGAVERAQRTHTEEFYEVVKSSGPHHQDSGEAKIRESTAGVSRKPSSDGKARGCSSKHVSGLTP